MQAILALSLLKCDYVPMYYITSPRSAVLRDGPFVRYIRYIDKFK